MFSKRTVACLFCYLSCDSPDKGKVITLSHGKFFVIIFMYTFPVF